MRIARLANGGLLLTECIRIFILAVIILIQGNERGFTIEIVLIAPSALFFLMALFIFLDTNKYKEYARLFAAGKCLSIFIILGWFILTAQVTIIEGLILSGDLFSMAFILLVIRDSNNNPEIPKITNAHKAPVPQLKQESSPEYPASDNLNTNASCTESVTSSTTGNDSKKP